MKKIKYSVLPLIVFFGLVYTAHAGFEITEIMYDLDGTDTNREWAEVQNTGTDSADLSTWFLFSDNTKHALVPQGASQISSGAYAVIAQNADKFKTDWPNYSGLLFDSSWTGFNNDGETIALKDPSLNVVGPVTFTSSLGGAGDGNSLAKVSGSWVGAIPTPGGDNQAGSPGGGGGASPGAVTPPVVTPVPAPVVIKKKEVEIARIATDIIVSPTVFAGLPFKMNAHTTGVKKEFINSGRFIWNFGDGMTMTTPTQNEFEYTYPYPGEYVVTLSYYFNDYSKVVDATDRVIVKVVPSGLSISSVGIDSDPFVELENKSDFELSLLGWTIVGLTHSFTIPQGTVILPTKRIKFSPKITGFTQSDLTYLTLKDQQGTTFAVYPVGSSKSSVSKNSVKSSSSSSIDPAPTIDYGGATNSSIIDLNDLGASASNLDTNISSRGLAWLGLIAVIAVGLTSVIAMRRRHDENNSLEKDISVDDMKIME